MSGGGLYKNTATAVVLGRGREFVSLDAWVSSLLQGL